MVMALRARARGNHVAKQQNRGASSPSKNGIQTRRKTPNVRSQKCVASRQAWTKRILHTKTARFFQHLVEGRVIAGDAKMQRYRQSRQCPTRRGRRQPPPRRQWASRIRGGKMPSRLFSAGAFLRLTTIHTNNKKGTRT